MVIVHNVSKETSEVDVGGIRSLVEVKYRYTFSVNSPDCLIEGAITLSESLNIEQAEKEISRLLRNGLR